MEDTVGDERPIKKEEDERGEEQHSLLEEVMSDQGETESLTESTEGGVPSTSALDAANTVKFKILSPMGGRTLEFAMVRGIANRDAQDELAMHLTNIFKLGLGIKEAFEKALGSEWQDLPWSDVDRVVPIIQRLNKCISSVVSLWRGATRPKTESEWFQNPYCTAEQCKKISFTVFNRVVKNAQVLNKCYKSFSSLTYGETSFDQIQIILDRLKMTDKDVFVDLGSGVGHVVTYAAAYSNAKRCVGIEINNVPADMATKMKKEFEGMMSWYGKKYRPFDLIHGDFLDDTFKKLLTEEATVIYINNFAFDPNLMFNIKQRILEMPSGTRIICTKSLSEEREDRGRGEGDEIKKQRPISGRTLNRQTVDMMLDCDELPLADAPVSWSAGKGVQFLLFTVNHTKIEQIFQCAQNSSSGSGTSTRSGSAENVVAPIEDSHTDNSISATIDEVVSAKAPSTRGVRMYPEEDSDDNDDEDYPAPGSSRKNTSKAEKRRGGGDGGVPKKRSSTGASSSRHGKKDSKKEAKSTPSSARRFAAATEVPMQHRDTKVKKEEASSSSTLQSHQSEDGRVVLDPSNPLDAHLSESNKRAPKRSIGGRDSDKRRRGRPSKGGGGSDKENGGDDDDESDDNSSITSSPSKKNHKKMKVEEKPKSPEKPKTDYERYGPAVLGHTEDYDVDEAPTWAGKEGKLSKKHGEWKGVFAPHHSIFEEDLTNLPPRRRSSLFPSLAPISAQSESAKKKRKSVSKTAPPTE